MVVVKSGLLVGQHSMRFPMNDRSYWVLMGLFLLSFLAIIVAILFIPDPSDKFYCETGKLKNLGREGWMCITKPLEKP